MKKINHFALTSLVFIALLLTTTVQASSEKMYSTAGYPYQLLIARTDEIKIIYSEEKEKIECKVQILLNGEKLLTTPVNINKDNFAKTPLSSCLSRQQAKGFLAKTFE